MGDWSITNNHKWMYCRLFFFSRGEITGCLREAGEFLKNDHLGLSVFKEKKKKTRKDRVNHVS